MKKQKARDPLILDQESSQIFYLVTHHRIRYFLRALVLDSQYAYYQRPMNEKGILITVNDERHSEKPGFELKLLIGARSEKYRRGIFSTKKHRLNNLCRCCLKCVSREFPEECGSHIWSG